MGKNERMTISKISPSDLPLLIPFATKVFYDAFYAKNKPENYTKYIDQAFTLGQFQQEINNPASHFYWIVEDTPKAWLKINEPSAFTEGIVGNGLEIQRIYVDAKCQGKGYGKKLLDFTEGIAKEKEIAFIWLGVWERNLSAIKFYEKNGYSLLSSHEFIFGDEVQTDLIMTKKI